MDYDVRRNNNIYQLYRSGSVITPITGQSGSGNIIEMRNEGEEVSNDYKCTESPSCRSKHLNL